MERKHNTKQSELYPMQYLQYRDFDKPVGLWYSWNNEWLDFCKEYLPHRVYKNDLTVTIVDFSAILVISTLTDLISFQHKYFLKNFVDGVLYAGVNWLRVKYEFSGIEIRNYEEIKNEYYDSIYSLVVERRMDMTSMLWFLGLDCSSGCVWDLSLVKEINNDWLKCRIF
jgi:hypothetical protein